MPSDPPTIPPPSPFATPRALHPASILLGIPVRQLIQGLIVPVIITASAGPGLRFTVAVLALVGMVTLVFRLLAWQRFRFSFDGQVLRVDEGVLSRNHRALDVARIQQVEVDRSLLQRAFGLAALRVETAGSSGEVEVELRVLPVAEAQGLRAAVRASKARVTGSAAPASDGDGATAEEGSAEAGAVILRVGVGRIVAAAVTGSQLLVLPALLFGLAQLIGETGEAGLLDPRAVLRQTLEVGTAVLVALLIPASLAAATFAGILRDFGWTMRRSGDDLQVSRGLTSTRDSVVPLQRIQLIEIQRNWLRRPFGVATLRIHSAGGGGDDRRVTVPLLRDREVDDLIAVLLPGVPGVPALAAHPPAARRRAVFRWTRDSLVPAGLLWVVPGLPPGLRYLGVGLVVAAVVLGLVEHAQLASGRTARVVAARRGALSVTTTLAPLVKVQAVTTRASWFQRRLDLATVRAHVAGPGGDLVVLDVDRRDGGRLHRDLTGAAAAPR